MLLVCQELNLKSSPLLTVHIQILKITSFQHFSSTRGKMTKNSTRTNYRIKSIDSGKDNGCKNNRISGIDWYDGTAGARLFYRFYVSDSAKVASTIYGAICTRAGESMANIDGKYCGTRCATMQGTCSKSVGVHPSKCFSPGVLVESANR